MVTWTEEENKRLKELLNKTYGRNNVSREELKEIDYLLKKKQSYYTNN